MQNQPEMEDLLAAIVADDHARVGALLNRDPSLATGLIKKPRLYESKIVHLIYAGDTALHLAAAGYRVEIAGLLLAAAPIPTQEQIIAAAAHYTMPRMAASMQRRGMQRGR